MKNAAASRTRKRAKPARRKSASTTRAVQRKLNQLRMEVLQELQTSNAIALQRSETRWRGASQTLRSLAGWTPHLGSGKSDTSKSERDRLAARSYDAHRNHLIARAAITRLRTNVVGTGLTMHPAVDIDALGITEEEGDRLNSQIAAEARLYFDNPLECDMEATLDAYGQQCLALVTALLGGDCFALTPFKERPGCIYGLKVQLVDPARVSNQNDGPDTPTLQDGVEISIDGEPIAIHIRNQHPGDRTPGALRSGWTRREIFGLDSGLRRIFQIWNDKDRIGATRGVPYLAPILEPLQSLEQYTRAELIATVISSMFTVFIKKESQQVDDRGNPIPPIAGQTVKGTATDIQLGSGAVVDLAPGEEAQFADPTRPSAKFDPFFLAIVRQIGAALEIPLDELLLNYQASYSAARAAMLQAWRFYTMRRWTLVQQFCQPWYQLWFDEAVARGRIQVTDYADPMRRAAYTQAVWIGPARGAMDESQEASAAKTRLDAGVSNEAIEIMQMWGEPRSVVYRQRKRELQERKADGTELGPSPGQGFAPAGAGGARPGNPVNPNAPKPGGPPDDEDEEEEEEEEASASA
jgi:lambda family phage portal protein